MALVTTKELLLDAQKNGYAVGAFNVGKTSARKGRITVIKKRNN